MHILTFDIEEWFHILDNQSTKTTKEWANYEYRIHKNMDLIFSLLDDYGIKATFFCLGWVAQKFPEVIKKIDQLGYQIGSHSHMHQLVYEQSKTAFRDDLKQSIQAIEELSGKKVKLYRAPGFSITQKNLWAFEVLIESGIEIDCSVFPAKRAHGGLPIFPSQPSIITNNGDILKELPINTTTFFIKTFIFSGGGYFRLFPYAMIRRFMKRSKYVMTYFHPRDFDPKQPVIKDLSPFRKFKSYYGLQSAFQKLEKLIKEFSFIDIAEAEKKIDWQNVQKIKLESVS